MAWIESGKDTANNDAVSNYIRVSAANADGTAYSATAAYFAREWVLLQYDNVDTQDYWQVNYKVGDPATAWKADPTL